MDIYICPEREASITEEVIPGGGYTRGQVYQVGMPGGWYTGERAGIPGGGGYTRMGVGIPRRVVRNRTGMLSCQIIKCILWI